MKIVTLSLVFGKVKLFAALLIVVAKAKPFFKNSNFFEKSIMIQQKKKS